MNNTKIERSSTTTFLGVTIDEKLNFKAHAENVGEKAVSRLNLIKVLSHKSRKIGVNTLVKVYNSLTRSLFD